MAPGPSSSQVPSGSGSESASASGSGSNHSPPSPSAVTPDLKHCAGCGQQLESAIVPDPDQAGGAAQRIISVGSHAFVVRPPQATQVISPAQDSPQLIDDQGRPLCQACGEAARAARVAASERATMPDQAMDVDEQQQQVRAGSDGTAPPIDNTTPLSISIGGPSSSDARSDSPEADAVTPDHHTQGRVDRAHSFTRSQIAHNISGDDGHTTGTQDGSLSTPVPIVSVPSSSSVSSSGGQPLPSTSNTPSRSRPSPARMRPSSMTRPRLSDYPPSTHRSQSPSASRILGNPLNAPYRERTTQEATVPPVTWFNPLRPDPLLDISRLRTPPRGRGCLYPGALFNGTQKSGKLSYDVTVEILNVDLPNSSLDGYLNIRGLTEDWPELTTFFTAEIIGMEHDFITDRWGAKEADDMKHWSRFSPFKPLHRTLSRGRKTAAGLRFNHLNKPYVFMRWKERFLVPDWKVRDISGASFAGFYYVCAEFGDMSEWMEGSVDPSKAQLGQSARDTASVASRARPSAQDPSTTASRDDSPRRAARRRLGSQQVDLEGIATNELYSLSTSEQPLEDSARTRMTAAANLAATVAMIRNLRGVQGERRSRGDAETEETQPRSALTSIGASPLSRFRRRMPVELESYSDSDVPVPRVRISEEREIEIEEEEEEEEEEEDDTTANQTPAGKITAFYYHENSEPYQQLDLRHVPQRCLGSFEMR